jgi:predicted secreted protein
MTIEAAINDLTIQTTSLLDTCVGLRGATIELIADAVAISQNEALIPLAQMATNLIDTQALLVMYIARGI